MRFFCIFAAIIAGVAGCGGDDGGNAGPPDGGMVGPPEPTPGTTVEVLRPIVLTERARLPEQDPELVDVEVTPDGLAFIYRSEVTRLPLAVDDVVAGIRHGGYLRRLTSVTQTAPTRIECATVHAELGELIGDGHFRVRFYPGTATGDHAPPPEGAARAALSQGWSVFTPSFRGWTCGGGASSGVTVDPRFDFDLEMELDVDIRWSTSFLIPRGEISNLVAAVTGAMEVGATIESTSSRSVSCTWDVADYAESVGIEPPSIEFQTNFAIGFVPVIITHEIKPSASFTIGGEIETGRTVATSSARFSLRAGASYTEAGGWTPIWMPMRMGTARIEPGMPGTLTLSAQGTVGLGYTVKVYDTFGPAFGIGPVETGTFRVMPDGCHWSAALTAGIGISGALELTVPLIDYKLASYSISSTLGETEIASTMGVFPWESCADAGAPDAGGLDAGMSTMGDGGSPASDAGAMDAGRPMTGSDAGPPDTGTADAGFRLPNGAPCTSRTQCRSLNCADGVCCNTGCALECESCVARTSRAAADGTCAAMREDTDPDDECPGTQTCQADSLSVTAAAYCEAHFGDPCTGPGMCPDAGFCADGVCCNLSTCGGATGTAPCTSCRTAHTGAAEGICSAVVLGLDPYNYCMLPGSVCNGMNGCCLETGTACTRASDCCSGTCSGTCG